MRIIAGKMKGRKLLTPINDDVRPTADMVKEAICSMIDGYLEGAVIVDLFAGSGNIGLEALSRGAKVCYFGDYSAESIKLIKSNIEICKAEDQSRVIAGNYEKVITKIPEKVDIIFLDPPYESGYIVPSLKRIHDFDLLKENGVIVCEHGASEALPDTVSAFCKIKEKRYGIVFITFFEKMSINSENTL